MTETLQQDTNYAIVVSEDGRQLEKQKARQAAALLLTRAPIDTLSDELDRISTLAPHFHTINMGIRQHLRDDPHADQLRTTLMKFNIPMDAATEQIYIAFANARAFYAHNREEIIPPRDGHSQLTKERVATLLERNFQEGAIKRAREVAEQVANAANIVRDVLPLLPQLEKDLNEYVANYIDRISTRDQRKRSWMWSMIDNIFGDPVPQTPWNLEQVKGLPWHLSDGIDLMRLLPAFLDNMELHFRRLSEIQTQQVIHLGYTTAEDLIRLYQDRLACINILLGMESKWSPAVETFSFGAMKKLPR